MARLEKLFRRVVTTLRPLYAWYDGLLRRHTRWVFWGSVGVLVAAAVGIIWLDWAYEAHRRQQEAIAQYQVELAELEEDMASREATTLIFAYRDWEQAASELDRSDYPREDRVRFRRRLGELAVDFRDHAVVLLTSSRLLAIREYLLLAGQLQALQDRQEAQGWSPATGREVENTIAHVLTRAERRLNRLYAPDASLTALYQARTIVDLATNVAEARRAEQLRTFQRRIDDHVALLETQTNPPSGGRKAPEAKYATTPPDSADRASQRARKQFAGNLEQQLASTDLVQSVRTGGDEDQVLVVGGAGQVGTLTERFVYPAATRSKLRALGFREFIAQGKDGMLHFDLVSQQLLEKRLRDPSEVFRSEGIEPTRGG